jgi:DNA-binding response OmpR family regulator
MFHVRDWAPAPRLRHRVLIVEDDHDTGDVLCEMIAALGHDPYHVDTGHRAEIIAPAIDPEIAFVDLGLPDLDGYEVATRLRAWSRRRSLQIHALTGWSHADERRVGVFDRYLVKPIDRSTFVSILRELPYGRPGRRATDVARGGRRGRD